MRGTFVSYFITHTYPTSMRCNGMLFASQSLKNLSFSNLSNLDFGQYFPGRSKQMVCGV